MKKLLSLVFAMLMLLSLCACGGGGDTQETTEPTFNAAAAEADIAQLEALYEGRETCHGEMHDHSDSGGRSDGKVPLMLWPNTLIELDIDFATLVDHKQSSHMRLPEWDNNKFVGGTEAATTILEDHLEQAGMHYNMIFTDPDKLDALLKENLEYRFGPDNENPGNDTFIYAKFSANRFREIVAQVREKGGFFVHVHPRAESYLKSDDPLDYWYGDYTGFEVLCGYYGNMNEPENVNARDTWIAMLDAGKIVYATSGSDSHRMSNAISLTTIYSAEKNATAYLDRMRAGDFTAGPVGIRMAVGDTCTGGQTDFTGKRLVISVGDFHSQAVQKGHQYRLDLYNENGLVFSQEFDNTQTAYFAIDAEECKYYRAEVYDVTDGYIFAVGNPIWNAQ